MTARELVAACQALTGSVEERPFRDPDVTVFKVGGKIFAITRLEADPLRVSLKCEPELAQQLRVTYPTITPGYHLNKRHWNTVVLDGSLPRQMVLDMIEDSYDLIVASLSRAQRAKVGDPGLEPGTSSLSEKRSNRLS
jgi:predicted DNA-binding protein (MmcQ/YjbR family)